jgi:retron-type reverse transcriptase
MNASGKSYRPIVPAKRPNKARQGLAAEAVEERGLAKGNSSSHPVARTQGRDIVLDGVERVRQAARRNKAACFTALLHHVDPESPKVALERTRKDAAAGIDGITKEHYGRELEANLARLNDLVHRGAYRPKPSRRVWIPKEDGGRRPLAIGALEDKVVQRAVAEVLGAVYEEDFAGFSYAFRPGRNQHDALNALAVGINRRKVSWILDVDIKSYFDSIDHDKLLDLLQVRIADKRILRLIRRWLEAGVVEDGELTECNTCTTSSTAGPAHGAGKRRKGT